MNSDSRQVPAEEGLAPPRILIVDDEEPILKALRRTFQGQPFDVSTYSDPGAALEAIRREQFSLIIADNRMPGLNGIELLEQAKSISPDTVRVMLTGHADLNAAIAAINKGEINLYLTKPWDTLELMAHVREGLEKYQLRISVRRQAEELQARNAQLADANAELKVMALRDRMTGLYNHGEFQEDLTRQFKLFRRDRQPFCLAMGDIDDFKKVNDTYGHPVGDEVIRSVASTLRNHLRGEVDTVFRYGGEEFAVILRNTTTPNAVMVMERMLGFIRQGAVETRDGPLSVTMSFGAGQARETDSEGALVHDVDKALYRAKRAGKNRIEPVE